jgi:hypothetical protein
MLPGNKVMATEDDSKGIQEKVRNINTDITEEVLEQKGITETGTGIGNNLLPPGLSAIKQKENELIRLMIQEKIRIAKENEDLKDKYQKLREFREDKYRIRKDKYEKYANSAMENKREAILYVLNQKATRMEKSVEYFYSVLEKLSKYIEEQQSSGFGTTIYNQRLDAIELQIETAESILEQLNVLINEIENNPNMTEDELREIFNQSKAYLTLGAQNLTKVKVQLLSLTKEL